jgi:ligand-binding SRPBCC domain-containing protein
MRYTFQSEQWLPYSVDVVFVFFADPKNLPRLMPAWQSARIEEAVLAPAPPQPVGTQHPEAVAGAGTRLTLSFRPFPFSPLRVPWEAEITEFEWNDHFCDRQVRGPFAYWNHCHSLRSQAGPEGEGTLLLDTVEYEMPLGILGEFAQRLFVARQLRSTFAFRHTRTADLLSRIMPIK